MGLRYEDIKEILKRIGLAVLLFSFWNMLSTVFQVLIAIVLAILVGSCIATSLKNKLTGRIGGKLVEYSNIDVIYVAFGLGLVLSGARIMTTGMVWVGVATLISGAFFIGAGIGQSVNKIRQAMPKGKKPITGAAI